MPFSTTASIHFDGDPMSCGKELDVELIPQGIKIVVNAREQLYVPPLFRAFSDIYEDMTHEAQHLREEVHKTDVRIKAINRNLLRKLKQK